MPSTSTTSPVYGYLKRPSLVDFPGTLAAVMFTAGCNFTCGYCHNSSLMRQRRKGMTWEKLAAGLADFKAHWVKGASITGGEPTLWKDELIHLVQFVQRQGLKVKVDTNGSLPEVIRKLVDVADFIAMDVKCAPESYEQLVNFKHGDRILESIDIIRSSSIDHEFRTTVVPSFHTDEQMLRIREAVQGARRFALQPFIPRDDLPNEKYRNMFRTPAARMEEIRQLMDGCAETVELRGN